MPTGSGVWYREYVPKPVPPSMLKVLPQVDTPSVVRRHRHLRLTNLVDQVSAHYSMWLYYGHNLQIQELLGPLCGTDDGSPPPSCEGQPIAPSTSDSAVEVRVEERSTANQPSSTNSTSFKRCVNDQKVVQFLRRGKRRS
jgi:hypothetical protein